MIILDCETARFTAEAVGKFCAMGWTYGNGEVQITQDLAQAHALVQAALDEGELVVGHNVAYDLAVLGCHIGPDAEVWDSMIADILLRLAATDCVEDWPGPPAGRSLAVVSGRALVGKDTTRLSYVAGQPLTSEQAAYLTSDVEATWAAYTQQCAHPVPGGAAEMLLQVRASLALAQLQHTGLPVDHVAREQQAEAFAADQQEASWLLQEAGLYRPARTGPRGGKYAASLNVKAMQTYAGSLLEDAKLTDGGTICLDKDQLSQLTGDPVVDAWLGYKSAEKMCAFLRQWEADVMRPNYRLMMRTGRTSCSKPNLQQVPSRGKRGEIKSVFVAPPGREFYEIDFHQLELCCLAELTRGRMQELINAGQDLHRAVGACYTGRPAEEVTKAERQLMKCLNFGLPGGMGVRKFRTFLRTSGVEDPGPAVVQKLFDTWVTMFPEMVEWLADDCSAAERMQRMVWRGTIKDGSKYAAAAWDLAWMIATARRPAPPKYVLAHIAAHEGMPVVEKWVVNRHVSVAGGRTRCPVNYTEYRNTQFQGLAANLAKEALADLVLDYPDICTVHAFVHDSVLISVPIGGRAQEAAAIMLSAAKRWLPTTRVGVEICGPGRSWKAAKDGNAEEMFR